MKISAATFVTNPWSSGYLIYLPAIQSFLDLADEVIVVDGGSTDDSLERLSGLRGHERIRVVSTDQTYWGPGDAWERAQFGIQRQTAFEMSTGDWVIHFDADHLLPERERPHLLEQLRRLQDDRQNVLYAFRLVQWADGRYHKIKKLKRWCINKKLAVQQGINIGYGLKQRTGGNERPIWLDRQEYFIDPVTDVKKYYYTGEAYARYAVLDSNLYKYDHFFLDTEQLQRKLQRFENMRARCSGGAPAPVGCDERPYRLMRPEAFLANRQHPQVLREFFEDWAADRAPGELDVIGLRCYPEAWRDWLRRCVRRLVLPDDACPRRGACVTDRRRTRLRRDTLP